MLATLARSTVPGLVVEDMETGVYMMCEVFDLVAKDKRDDLRDLARDGRWLGFWRPRGAE